ncbi:hypothetical protein [Lewinella sp. IMCC34191]|uniref:hypothetical protein n=1 Tax=Lewinella sp. IMCC34191 TaxID=2259172 RepID=UPI000E232CCC|nr:hypothetical protein [Lewinella sp. IMCC34191]
MLSTRLALAVLCLALTLSACSDDDSQLPVAGVDAELLVDNYNYYLDDDAPEADRAFAAIGEITETRMQEMGEEDRLSFTFTPAKKKGSTRQITVDVEEAIHFPPAIDRAKLIYLGEQLIIVDLESDFFLHLTDGGENLIPQLPYTECNDLRLAIQSPPSRRANSK